MRMPEEMDHDTLVREVIQHLRGHLERTPAMIQVLYDWNPVSNARRLRIVYA